MKNKIPESKKPWLEAVVKLARQYDVKIIEVITVGDEVYINYDYKDEKKFGEYLERLKKIDKNFEIISEEGKAESYTV